MFDTGHNRKTDAHDAHAVGVVAVRTRGLRVLSHEEHHEALRMLIDRRQELTRRRIQTVNRLQRLLSQLTPGTAKKDITALQAKGILALVRPRDLAGKTRRGLALEQLGELVAVDKKIKKLTKELKVMVLATGSTLMDLPGVGPVVAARFWPTSRMWPGSPTATGSRPGPEPHRSKHPPARSSATGSPGPATGGWTT